MDARLAKMEKKLGISGGGVGKSKKELKKEKQKAKQEKAEIRQLAAKSLEVGNWTEQLLTGGGEKFSSRVEESLDDKLSKETVGLVTFDELRKKKEELERESELAKRKAEEDAEREDAAKKKQKAKKKQEAKNVLSFGDDEEEEEG